MQFLTVKNVLETFQSSLRDSLRFSTVPSAEALGYYRAAPPGRWALDRRLPIGNMLTE